MILLGLLAWAQPGLASAQAEGAMARWAWRTGLDPIWGSGGQLLFSSPDGACMDQYSRMRPTITMGSIIPARYLGAIPLSPSTYKCLWNGWPSPGTTSASCRKSDGTVSAVHKFVPPGICTPSGEPKVSRPTCNYNQGANTNPLTGDPVILASGALYERAVDYQDSDQRLTISRTYRSNYGLSAPSFAPYAVPFGIGDLWRLNFQWELALETTFFTTSGSFGVVAPDGSNYAFVLGTDGAVTAKNNGVSDLTVQFDHPAGTAVRLADVAAKGGRFTVTTSAGVRILMALFVPEGATKYLVGRPLQITRRDGYRWDLAYGTQGELQSIGDSLGRTIQVAWHYAESGAPKAIRTLTMPDGTALAYGYDGYAGGQGFSRLTTFSRSATAADTEGQAAWRALFWSLFAPVSALPATTAWPVVDSTTYVYDDPKSTLLLTGVIDNTGVRASTWQYDTSARVVSAQRAGGADAVTIAYATDTTGTKLTRTVTNAAGKQTVYAFTNPSPTLTKEPLLTSVVGDATTSCARTDSSITYDLDNRRKSVKDQAGHVTGYAYGTDGRVKSITEATGTSLQRATTYTWHATLGAPTKVVKPGLTTDYVYDSAGRLTSMTETDTTTITAPYATNGRARTWSYTYDSQGLRIGVDGPLAGALDSTSYDYDLQGHIKKVTNGVGHTWQITGVDPAGRPTTIIDPNLATTTLAYDGAGRLYNVATPESSTTYLYDAAGNLGFVSTGAGASITYSYDAARRLVDLRDEAGNHVHFTLDANGNRKVVEVLDPANLLRRTQTRIYDELDRLLKVQDPQQQETVLGYDALGNVDTSTRRGAVSTTSQFDALNRLFKVTDPMAGVTSYQYDGGDHVVTVTDARGKVTRYTVDGFGQVIQVVSPEAGTSVYTYDSAGNLLTRRDAKFQTTSYKYDHVNRPTLVTYADVTTVAFTYDEGVNGVGHLTTMADASGTTTWAYDAAGHVVRKVQTVGSTILATDAYYQNGYLTGLRLPSGHFIDYFWGTSAITGVNADGTPLATDISSEPFGAPSAWTFANGEVVGKTYDLSGRMTAHELGQLSYDTGDRITGWTPSSKSAVSYARNFGYDDLDRLISNDTDASTYSYDANGNRTNQTLTTWVLPTKISTTSNRIISGSDWFNPVLYSYDANGSVTKDPFLTYSYDTAGRLKAANTWDYAYNGLGQRVRKQHLSWRGDTTILFVYDEAGHLLGEYDGNGLPIQETIWLGDTPLAVLKPAGTYYVHADHLDTPRQISDGLGRTVWAWDSWDFGAGGAHETLSGAEFIYNLRFPGQYFDSETGLHHNGHRYYNPYTGRYLESDPIGQAGGLNTYAYVGSNPLGVADPTGLDPIRWFNTEGGRRVWHFPTVGNWIGLFWSGGQYSGEGHPMGTKPPVDSGDACAEKHDKCVSKCPPGDRGCEVKCNLQLVDDLRALPFDPREWEYPPTPGTELDAILWRAAAIAWWAPPAFDFPSGPLFFGLGVEAVKSLVLSPPQLSVPTKKSQDPFFP